MICCCKSKPKHFYGFPTWRSAGLKKQAPNLFKRKLLWIFIPLRDYVTAILIYSACVRAFKPPRSAVMGGPPPPPPSPRGRRSARRRLQSANAQGWRRSRVLKRDRGGAGAGTGCVPARGSRNSASPALLEASSPLAGKPLNASERWPV